jgi:hypothetical protein
MNKLLVVVLCLAIPLSVFASDNSYTVLYDGGSIQGAKVDTEMKLYIESNQIRLVKHKTEVITIPVSAVTEISYGQDVRRRVVEAVGLAIFTLGIGSLLAFSKSKKHFVGLTWVDGDKKGGFVLQCDKHDYRGVLAGLEGVTGQKAVDSEHMNVKD